jgi:ABC-type branched-subunit amino acid transport system ATPase component
MPPSRTVFVQVDSWDEIQMPRSRAIVGLKWDRWNDYGFETSFEVRVYWPDRKPLELGVVKILRGDQTSGRTPLKKEFVRLSEDYCSLGQDIAYYEMLHKLGPWARTYLRALRDLVASPVILKSFEDHGGFRNSLIRSSGAEIALSDAPNLFVPSHSDPQSQDSDRLAFALETTVGGNTFEFSVGLGMNELDERCAAVIGYNAAGKTRLLGNIGMIASRKPNDPDELRIRRQFGEFLGQAPKLSGVLAISYSAFDTFEIPRSASQTELVDSRTDKEAQGQRGYIYCGLRKSDSEMVEFKTAEELRVEFLQALERCRSRGLRDRLLRCMGMLGEEPSFQEYAAISTLMQKKEEKCAAFYDSLSTGHKLVLKVVTQLVAYLQKSSLVLFDEPETHLHPSLVAALMKCLRLLLKQTFSFAIIATHSPVVIQETPSRNVYVLKRNGRTTTAERVSIETFGENIGLLTSEVFDLDASQSDYRHILQNLAERSLGEIDTLFVKPLGIQARSFIRSVQSSKR